MHVAYFVTRRAARAAAELNDASGWPFSLSAPRPLAYVWSSLGVCVCYIPPLEQLSRSVCECVRVCMCAAHSLEQLCPSRAQQSMHSLLASFLVNKVTHAQWASTSPVPFVQRVQHIQKKNICARLPWPCTLSKLAAHCTCTCAHAAAKARVPGQGARCSEGLQGLLCWVACEGDNCREAHIVQQGSDQGPHVLYSLCGACARDDHGDVSYSKGAARGRTCCTACAERLRLRLWGRVVQHMCS